MTTTKVQATQTVLYDVLSEIANAQNEQLDILLGKINTSLKVPGMLSLGAGLVVNVANTTLTKPNGTKVRLVLGDVDIGGLSGSVNFSTGTGSGDVQTVSLPTLTPNQWYKAGFEVRSDKKIYIVFGAIGASEALAGFPNWSEVGVSLGYISLQVNGAGDGWVTPTASSINQFGGGGGGGQADHTLLTNRSAANQHPTTSVSTVTGEFTGSSELTATEDEVQKALVRLAKYDSIFNWVDGGVYRVGNVVKAVGTNGTTLYRCITAHTASGSFDDAKFELIVSAQNHNTSANRDAASAHPTTSIDTVTGDFSGELSATEDTSQKAFVRLEQFGSIFNWATSKGYRVGNIVKQNGSIYRCIVLHTSGTFATDFNDGKWELLVSIPVQEVQTVSNPAGQTVFTLASITVPSNANSKLMVFINGIYQLETLHYTVDSSTQITFTSTIPENAQVVFRVSY